MTDAAAPAPMRIGVFGGTFDPPHAGHAAAIEAAVAHLALGRLLVMVAGDPWQKTGAGEVTPAADRLAMAAALREGLLVDRPDLAPVVRLDDREVRREGPSATADTLAELAGEYPGAELLLLLGADAAALLDTWLRPTEVRDRATIVVMRRSGTEGGAPPGWAVEELDVDLPALSSSELRVRYAAGELCTGLVPEGVDRVVRDLGLYGTGGRP